MCPSLPVADLQDSGPGAGPRPGHGTHNCRNCGGPTSCDTARMLWHCGYCGTEERPAPSRDGITTLGQVGRGSCPHCPTEQLLAGWAGPTPIDHCGRCGGFVIPQDRFYPTLVELRSQSLKPAGSPQPLDPRELRRSTRCPYCRQTMDTHAYAGGGAVVIDTCTSCRVIWLDRHELSRLVDFPARSATPTFGVTAESAVSAPANDEADGELNLTLAGLLPVLISGLSVD